TANRLQDVFPPSDSYPDLREVTYYIQQAVARVLAIGAEDLIATMPSVNSSESDARSGWRRNINGRTICDGENSSHAVRFDICRASSSERWNEEVHPDKPTDDGSDLTPELRVYATWPAKGDEMGKVVTRKWA